MKRDGIPASFWLAWWGMFLVGAAFVGGVAYVAIHFLSKVW